jgi:rare lipoprotein A
MRLRVELIAAGLVLASCNGSADTQLAGPIVPLHRRPVIDDAVKVGTRYCQGRRSYTPRDDCGYEEIGTASWHGEELCGSRTANGETFDPDGILGAHRTLPLPSYVEVTSLETGRTILVRINDRGPFYSNRIIDLSLGAARQLGISGRGVHQVRLRRVEPSEKDKLALRRGQVVAALQAPAQDDLARFSRPRRLAGAAAYGSCGTMAEGQRAVLPASRQLFERTARSSSGRQA